MTGRASRDKGMTLVLHVWQTDFGVHTIPPQLAEATKFRRDGWPDQRCRVRNRPFLLWLEEVARKDGVA